MEPVFAPFEKFLLAVDKRTFYRWLRRDYPGSGLLRYVGGCLFWLAYARRPYVGTRVVEIPWLMSRLKSASIRKEKMLVVGDVVTRKLADMGYDVDLVDMDAEVVSDSHLRVQKLDIRQAKLPQGVFDVVVSISTLEHVGVQGVEFADGDRLAAKLIYDAMKPGGLFLVTVPFGKPYTVKGFTRIYDLKGLHNILDDCFTVEEETFYVWSGFSWKRANLETAQKAGFLANNPDRYPGQNLGLALVMARKK